VSITNRRRPKISPEFAAFRGLLLVKNGAHFFAHLERRKEILGRGTKILLTVRRDYENYRNRWRYK
jgi:hypothetical protein